MRVDFRPPENNPHRLDLEFRRILSTIKQLIPHVDSNTRLSLYRSWLEKLSSTASDKCERNRYLEELARQIGQNRVMPPFDRRPPIGPLQTFPEVDRHDDTMNHVHLKYPNSGYRAPGDSDNPPQPLPSIDNALWKKPPPSDAAETGAYCVPQLRGMEPAYYDNSRQQIRCSQNKRIVMGTFDDVIEKDDRHFTPTNGGSDGVHEDSSWCDLTDTSATSVAVNSMGRGDAAEKSVAIRNERTLSDNAEHLKADEAEQDDPVDITSKAPDNVDGKFALKDTHFICADWKKTIESLQMRLTETLSQNNELKSMIQALKAKSNYENSCKEQNESVQRRNAEDHVREVELLRKSQNDQLRKMQQTLEFQIDEVEENYKLKMEEIKADAEMRMRELKLEYEEDKREKDKEIHRLSDIIQQQCIRMSNEIVALRKQIETSLSNNSSKNNVVPEEKVFVLQKCVSKMDKLFHKSEKDYAKQIEKLKQELELKDKVAQIQLRTQRAELISRTNADRQKQIEDVVNNLEVKYIKMLEHHENQVSESKKLDEEKIEYLKDLLKKNGIPFVV